MKRLIFTSLTAALLLAPAVFAQPAADVKTQVQQPEMHTTQNQNTTITKQPTSVPARQTETTQQVPTPPNSPQIQPSQTQNLGELQNQLQSIKNQLKENQPWTQWFPWWWKINLTVGLLWFLVWIFIGWQWTHFKFWGFGWPWPWWFWIPIFWLVPWFIIGWFWWPFWGLWWFWIWVAWPWVFWPIWWIILFKEAIIWHWRRRKGEVTTD